ncbi:MAG: TonB-dependent receptor [Bacteroidales bacterium]|nr:TonB-dependent receptor [Bacteroidales bacterium]
MKKSILIILSFFLPVNFIIGQDHAILLGHIIDSLERPIDLANVAVMNTNEGTMTNSAGFFEIKVPAGVNVQLNISCIGYEPEVVEYKLQPGETKEIKVVLRQQVKTIDEISVSARQDRASTFQNIDVKDLDYMPSTTGKIEAIIKSQAGVSSNNELSSQYSVRGGNFDENLIYVNDIEIYRPFLVRSGQQEGLSFVNSDLVSSIRFSAGGFDARYGDKMSSALDITYKRPDKFRGSTSLSLLGASLHFEGSSRNKKFSYLAGYRYKTTSYLLNTLETSGDYNPWFSDLQSLITYRFSRKVELSFLGNYSSNKYLFIPKTRDTEFGTEQLPFNLRIYYDGQELDQFNTYLGALSLHIKPASNLSLKFIFNAFQTIERETFDIKGQYWINELDNTAGSETFGDSILNLAVGSLHNHARNYLDAYVLSGSHLGKLLLANHTLKWGIKYQYQDFYDRISEWEMVDSAGYSIPNSGNEIALVDQRRAENRINYDLINAFIQDTWELTTRYAEYFLTMGFRGSVWNFNKTFMPSPRMTISLQPYWEKDIMFHLSGGYYFQPPFYKEMRMSDDRINYDIKPQKSIHVLFGGDYIFTAWDRPFKLTAEMYYKWLSDLIPFKIENVRIQYAGENIASGYATGIDIKLNGEFVPDAESWFTASLMQTREDIPGDSIAVTIDGKKVYEDAGYYSRPTDQLFTAGVYFQDYLPNNPDYKVTLSAFFGTGLPLSHPDEDRYYTTYRMKPYRRVDLGFSKSLKRKDQQLNISNPFRHFSTIWLSAEVFNLLGIRNEASYTWIRTTSNQSGISAQYGVPNYLTGRRFNAKITARF